MMDFITIPLVVGTITLGIYKLFELFVCKKERITMIEKLADRVNTGEINSNLSLNLNYSRSRFTFGSLKRAAGSFPHRDENTEEREGIKNQNPRSLIYKDVTSGI